MKEIMMFVIVILVSVCLAGVAFADGTQTANKSVDTKKVSPPTAKNAKQNTKKAEGSSAVGQKKGGNGAATTTKQSKQQHDRAKQTIDNLK